MRADHLLLAALVAAVALPAAPGADACGPDFPIELLADRAAAMATLPEGVFFDDVATLVTPRQRYLVVVGGDDEQARSHGGARERALYDAGAAAFHRGDRTTAGDYFERLLALPRAQRIERSTWAAYMLGRLHGDGPASVRYYRLTRALVDDDFADELGLAAASLGAEAQYLDDPVARVTLYAEQAALGHPDGATSLLFVMRGLIARDAVDEILDDPIGQKLVATYLFDRDGELTDEQRARLWRAIATRPHPAGADRLAAAAYRRGRWDDAARLAAGADDTAIARWVRAKLALRGGDRAAAARLLDDAAAALRAQPGPDLDRTSGTGAVADLPRLDAERAILALATGRYRDAIDAAWAARAGYRDALFIAERVLTLDELRAFVDALPPSDDPDDEYAFAGVTALRDLLGRRFMRAHRWAEAAPYLRLDTLEPDHRDDAADFAMHLDAAAATRDRFARAAALYQASRIARRSGLELLGTSHAPDWATWGAGYDLGDHSPATDDARWRGPLEYARVAASAPAAPQRYHYRYLASALAEEASALLPHQSQAYAATLCWAARHVFFVDTDRVQRLYRRYVDHGPSAVDMNFGQACPEPEFEPARRFAAAPPRAHPYQHLLPIAAVVTLLATLATLALTRRRHFAARP